MSKTPSIEIRPNLSLFDSDNLFSNGAPEESSPPDFFFKLESTLPRFYRAPRIMAKKAGKDHPLTKRGKFRAALHRWFSVHGKDLPWRRTRDPWAILVSEIMLQQTTVASVLAHRRFELFMDRFPDIATMARAGEEEILKAWEGLGYYNRVRNLQKAARSVIADFSSDFPAEAAALETLPGVGRYTAGAVSSFAFDRSAPIVDGNIARVLSRLLEINLAVDSGAGQKATWEAAGELLDGERPRDFNSALMELGQTLCTPRNPSCGECPVRSFCQCREPETLPVKKPRRKFEAVDEHTFLHRKGDSVLLARGDSTRRRGFWHLPVREADACAHLEVVAVHRYTITHHRVTVHLYRGDPGKLAEGEVFQPIAKLESLPIASPIRKILQKELK